VRNLVVSIASLGLCACSAPGAAPADLAAPGDQTAATPDDLAAAAPDLSPPAFVAASGTTRVLTATVDVADTGRQAIVFVPAFAYDKSRAWLLLVNDGQFVLAFTQIVGRGAKVRTEASVQGMTLVQAYDGKGGWQINPFMGRRDPERLSVDDSKALVELAADFDGSLFDAPLKGNRLEYLGVEDVDGTPAHKIKLTRGNGDVEYVYLDPDHYLEIRVLSQRTEQGVTVENETNLGDYEKIAGVYVPFAVESGRKGSTDRQRLMLDKAEVNVNVDPAVFAFPAAPAQAAK